MYYNVRKKAFPDGTMQYMYFERGKQKEYKQDEKKETGDSVERGEKQNMSRAIQKVYDLARSNEFDWFVTMTFNQALVNRYDYDSCSDALYGFTHKLSKRGNTWLIVPEQHQDGAFHMHGLISGDLDLTHWKGDVYNLNDFKWGFTTATPIKDRKRVSSYIAKYLTKEIVVPKGRKRYWASRALKKPMEDYVVMSTAEFGKLFNDARYQKVIDSPYGKFVFCET